MYRSGTVTCDLVAGGNTSQSERCKDPSPRTRPHATRDADRDHLPLEAALAVCVNSAVTLRLRPGSPTQTPLTQTSPKRHEAGRMEDRVGGGDAVRRRLEREVISNGPPTQRCRDKDGTRRPVPSLDPVAAVFGEFEPTLQSGGPRSGQASCTVRARTRGYAAAKWGTLQRNRITSSGGPRSGQASCTSSGEIAVHCNATVLYRLHPAGCKTEHYLQHKTVADKVVLVRRPISRTSRPISSRTSSSASPTASTLLPGDHSCS